MRDPVIESMLYDALANSEFDDYIPDSSKLELEPVVANLISIGSADRRESWLRPIYDRSAPDLRQSTKTLYHFKSVERALQIISSGEIGACSLASNKWNDRAEGEEFHRRYGSLYPLIPKNYSPAASDLQAAIGPSKRPIDTTRENIFILCLTQTYRNNRFWRDYVGCDRGVALELEYAPKANVQLGMWKKLGGWLSGSVSMHDLFEIRKVCYDTTGYLFDFLNELSFRFHQLKNEEKVLFLPGLTQFANWYKRGRYRWENEVRIVFDLQWIAELSNGNEALESAIQKYVKIDADGWRRIPIPLSNFTGNKRRDELMELSLKRVICGEGVSEEEQRALSEGIEANFARASIVERKLAGEDLNELH